MPKTYAKYATKPPRKSVTPPHVTLRVLRTVAKLNLDDVIGRVQQECPGQFPNLSRGTLSAIEKGYRGASRQLLTALCLAYGIDEGDITTDYLPRSREVAVADDDDEEDVA